jgi:hypothetical protein
MSAINGMRIIFSMENVNGAFVQNGLMSGAAGATANPIQEISVYDPTFSSIW